MVIWVLEASEIPIPRVGCSDSAIRLNFDDRHSKVCIVYV